MRHNRLTLLVCTGLVGLTLLAYGRLWRNDFVNLDDLDAISQNPGVGLGLSKPGFDWAWTTFRTGNWIPLTWLSLQLDASLFRMLKGTLSSSVSPAAVVHAQNLFWHTATVLLLFLTWHRLTGAFWRSALVAALFAVHPLHVESVAWASERKDVLSIFFGVLALLAYSRYCERPGWGRYLVVAAALVLGLLAKPMLVTLPFVLLLLDWWPLQRFTSPKRERGILSFPRSRFGLVWEKVPLLAITAAACVVAFLAQKHDGAVVSAAYLAFPDRLANAIVSCGWYLLKTFWPTGMAVYYCHPLNNWDWGSVLLSAGVLLGVMVLAMIRARQWPWLLVGWLWFLGTLVPVLGLVQVGEQARADRYCYLPHIGLFVALVWSAAALLDRLRTPVGLRAGLAGGCLGLLAAATWIQVGHWRDSVTLWSHALAVTIGNHRAHTGLGQFLLHQPMDEAYSGKLAQARDHFDQAVSLQPNNPKYHFNLGVALLYLGQLAEARKHLEASIGLDPHHVNAWHNLGVVQRRQGDPAAALVSFQRVLQLTPQAADAHSEMGLALWDLGRRDEARQEWETALRINPNEPEALNGLGLVLLRQGLYPSALERFSAAVAAAPGLSRAWNNLGVTLGRLRRWEEAQACQEKAVQLEQTRRNILPNIPPADEVRYRCQLGMILNALRQPEAAAGEYEKATQLEPCWPWINVARAWQLAADPEPLQRDPATAWELIRQAFQAARSVPNQRKRNDLP